LTSTAFAASELQEIDLSEQMEPVITVALGGLAGFVPRMTAVAVLFVNSVTSGSANALWTLRGRTIAKRSRGSLVCRSRGAHRRAASRFGRNSSSTRLPRTTQ
jgi:hypothetical protein